MNQYGYRSPLHDSENYQYLEIGGDVPQQEGPTRIETYHCNDTLCSGRTWTEQQVESGPDWTRPSCTVYNPAGSAEDVVLVVSGGISFVVSCESWLPDQFTCIWNVREVAAIQLPFPETDNAQLVTLNNVPTLFGVSGTNVFQFGANELWQELGPMTRERINLVAVSVPDDYICFGKHLFAPLVPPTTTTTTTTSTSTSTTSTTTTTSTTSTPETDECENEGICSRTDSRGVLWEAGFGIEAVRDCPEESEGGNFFDSFFTIDQVLPVGIVLDARGTSLARSQTEADVLRNGSTTSQTWYHISETVVFKFCKFSDMKKTYY